ncbi:DUF2934 domain-containing protein [Ancylobacter lacus]|uniref:DUF2934 domain-containing protein n=1 Tax=Ancylobacter lacus TaxID=2579970 RepID=UPI001BCCE312|nr:DUF2934 domain-containing protein [Ancylobacter lacus]MBS7539579.1 DUF2934 domain-containing protein [Ancylobacter lacus]
MDDREQRIREKAYHLWVAEGYPHGRHERHWELASELVAIEDSQRDTLLPIGEAGEPVEPVEALENAGEFPTTTDQGEMVIPHAPEPEAPEAAAAPAENETLAAETAPAENEPVSAIDTIERTLEVPKKRRPAAAGGKDAKKKGGKKAVSPVDDKAGAMAPSSGSDLTNSSR